MPDIVALVTDLIFASRIESAARGASVSVESVRTLEALTDAVESRCPATVLIDLSAAGGHATDAIQLVHGQRPRPLIVAFGSHVDGEAMHAARQAGADRVMARSQFVAELARILSRDEP